MIAWMVLEPETSLGFTFPVPCPFYLSLPPFLSGSSGHCYYQTIVTPVSLPDSPCSRIPHTVTLVSIPASAEGNNGCRGRGFSVAIDQPLSPTNGYSPEHGHTVRVSQWVCLSTFLCVCVFACFVDVIVWGGETALTLEVSMVDHERWKMVAWKWRLDSFKMYNRVEGTGNEPKLLLSDFRCLSKGKCVQQGRFFIVFFSVYCSLFRVDADCISPDVKNSIHVGDRILEINGTPIHNVPLDEVFTTPSLKRCNWSTVLHCECAFLNCPVVEERKEPAFLRITYNLRGVLKNTLKMSTTNTRDEEKNRFKCIVAAILSQKFYILLWIPHLLIYLFLPRSISYVEDVNLKSHICAVSSF